MAERLAEWAQGWAEPPARTREARRSVDGWSVQARWWASADQPLSDGPLEVVITLDVDTAKPADLDRGITTGVMRRLEGLLAAMAADVHGRPDRGAYEDMARAYVAERVAQLPSGPREDRERYYAGLLSLYDDLKARLRYPEPIKLLSSVMGVSRNTLQTRLRAARGPLSRPSDVKHLGSRGE